jgi:hypothetical protein
VTEQFDQGRCPVILTNSQGRPWTSDGFRTLCQRSAPVSATHAMRQRRETVEHPSGTMKARHGGDALPDQNAPTSRLAYNLTRVMNIVGIKPLIAWLETHALLASGTDTLRARFCAAKTHCGSGRL